jgi:hypothetical protein
LTNPGVGAGEGFLAGLEIFGEDKLHRAPLASVRAQTVDVVVGYARFEIIGVAI